MELQVTWCVRTWISSQRLEGKVNAANSTSMSLMFKGKMNMEAIPKQGKSSKGVLTINVAKGMLHKLFSFTTALLHDWKMYGEKKENGDIEIKLTHKYFEPIVFDRVLRFDDAILLAAKIKILSRNLNLEGAHTATLEVFPRRCYSKSQDILESSL